MLKHINLESNSIYESFSSIKEKNLNSWLKNFYENVVGTITLNVRKHNRKGATVLKW